MPLIAKSLFQFAPSVHPSSASICFVVINLRFDLDRPVNGDFVNYSMLNQRNKWNDLLQCGNYTFGNIVVHVC